MLFRSRVTGPGGSYCGLSGAEAEACGACDKAGEDGPVEEAAGAVEASDEGPSVGDSGPSGLAEAVTDSGERIGVCYMGAGDPEAGPCTESS
jgi:hypothetical protein